MDAVLNVINFILDLGPSVMMPIIITILGLALRQNFVKSFRAGLIIGVGFVGINTIIGLLTGTLGPVTQAMVKNMGVSLDIMDVGWPISAAVSFGSVVVPVVMPAILIINVIMLAFNWTKTANVDVWNYWQILFCASIVYHTTGNNWLWTIVATIICTAVTLVLADISASTIQKFFGMPGISLPHVGTVGWYPVAVVCNKILDKIPGINNIQLDQEKIQSKFGMVGEPLTIGIVLGAVLALLAKYDLANTLTTAITLGACMVLLPRMVAILMEGLIPLSEGAREFLKQRFPDREFYIGLDTAVVIGHPAVIATAIVMIPVAVLLAVVLPGNRLLPFTDLVMLTFILSFVVAVCNGNIFRSLIISLPIVALCLLIATDFGPVHTVMGHAAGFDFPEGANIISSLYGGTLQIPWLIWKPFAVLFNYVPM
ncbi:MAG TPA: PTS transporter subunit IIC [Peptococcaceae bacterium]|jgi:PTS system galactitol-specific IIC component|nr:PTS galactitol transporter subunit IIC [Clostridia bacterium]HOB81389.1 PTS transporter subunit IIC [Peptococcaceae bacterium]HPZ71530.1 PTS transporter subunit IIC [Peptococcaceae bacterium]HQD53440.1 PTS transporter subunit IIC [Peptococcaceae bacterium]